MSTGTHAFETRAEAAEQRTADAFTHRHDSEPAASTVQPLNDLRYTATPIQRHAAAAGGISADENAAVARLSGGRVDLHALGASVQRVPASDPRLLAVGARSIAQGTRALISSDADRGHEIWHLAQQAMGQVRADTAIGGQAVNTQPRLEAEADRMGAVIDGHSRPTQARAAGPAVAAARDAPVQRRVSAFTPTLTHVPYVPPVADLLKSVDFSYFTATKAKVTQEIEDELPEAKKAATKVPKKIEATIAANGAKDATPNRQTHKSRMVGRFGMAEFALRSGGTLEVFEGGHLIPHEVWSTQDAAVDSADDYVNLVPMSRSLNVGAFAQTWRSIETQMVEKYNQLKAGGSFKVSIDVDHAPYNVSYERLAQTFGLQLKGGKTKTDTVELYGWLPKELKASMTTGSTTKKLGEATENELHNTSTPIATPSELVDALKRTPLWDRIDGTLRDKVAAIK